MDKILVVGATGQLGTAVVKKLTAKGAKVRAVIRSSASAARFQSLGAETVIADLLQPESSGESMLRHQYSGRNSQRSDPDARDGHFRGGRA